MRFRAASCTGKLYHLGVSAVTGARGPLDADVYHFGPHTGDFDVLRDGTGEPTLRRPRATAPVVLHAVCVTRVVEFTDGLDAMNSGFRPVSAFVLPHNWHWYPSRTSAPRRMFGQSCEYADSASVHW